MIPPPGYLGLSQPLGQHGKVPGNQRPPRQETIANPLHRHSVDAPEPSSTANDRRQQQPANIKLGQPLNSRATHGNTLVMRSSAAPLPVLGPGGPAVRVGLPPDHLG